MREFLVVTAIGLRGLIQHLGTVASTVVGVACVSAVLVSLLAIGAGAKAMAVKNADPQKILIMSTGAPTEYVSLIAKPDLALIEGLSGIRRGPDGRPIVQAMTMTWAGATGRSDGTSRSVFVRGTGPNGWLMSPQAHLVKGRMYTPGLRELVVGRTLKNEVIGLEVGDSIKIQGGSWTIVGVFEEAGAISENALFGDVETLAAATGRSSYQSVGLELEKGTSLAQLQDALRLDPRLDVTARRYSDYYAEQVRPITLLVAFAANIIGLSMGFGACIAAVTNQYMMVDRRVREIATLRALGYQARAVLSSIIVESLILSVPGALLGYAAAWLVFHQQQVSVGGFSFALAVTPALALQGAILGLAVGLIGGIPPGIHAARRPVAFALQDH